MTVKLIDDKVSWDRFIDDSPYGLLFHKWDFLRIMEKHTGFELLPYGIYRREDLAAVFPVFIKRTKGLKLLYSPPQQSLTYVPYLGLVMGGVYDGLKQRRKEAYLNDVVDDMAKEISRMAPDYASIALVPGFTDVRPFKWNGYDADIHYTYMIDLERPLEEMLKNMESKTRRNIKAYEKDGFVLKKADDIETFFSIMKKSLSDEGLTYFQRQDAGYLIDVLKAYPDNLTMYFLYHGDEIVCLGINYGYKGRYILWMGGGVLNKNMDANDYFVWELIKLAKSEGYDCLENWGADLKRLSNYKSKFNPSLNVCFMLRKKSAVGGMAQWGYGKMSGIKALNGIRNMIR